MSAKIAYLGRNVCSLIIGIDCAWIGSLLKAHDEIRGRPSCQFRRPAIAVRTQASVASATLGAALSGYGATELTLISHST